MAILHLRTVDGFIAFDFDDCPTSAGGTRLAPDVSEEEVALLARAMTYKFAVLGLPMGGAKGGIRANVDERDEVMRRYCQEIRPLVESGRFRTGPDLGTFEADFAPLRSPRDLQGVMASQVEGVPFEDILTGFGVVAAAEAALGPLEGRSAAIEGFGKVGGGVAREVVRRGGRVVATSTVHGCVVDPAGLDVATLWAARALHGDRFVQHLGLEVLPPAALFDVEADLLVPGARTGVIDAVRAKRLRVQAVVPAANVPYTAEGLAVLQARGIAAQADFICNAGAVIGYTSARRSTAAQVMAAVENRIAELVRAANGQPKGPFAAACALAEKFLRTWRGGDGLPPAPPLA